MEGLDQDACKTYIYPTNYPLRDYQFNIVKASLLKNTLVCLPTGLGKTFIGAVLIYNYYRWYPNGKVVFLAPTRPLVAQQIEACFNVMGIPQEHTTEMTGTTSPETRKLIWKEKRVFFLTPQVLLNDLSREACPTQIIKLVVIDEAHKALGNHAVCHIIKQLKQQCYNFRVLALSATPGSDLQAIQQVITNLMISHIEIRNEDSPDIVQYTHLRSIETVVIPIEGELKKIKDQYMEIVKFYIFKLINSRVLFTKDETTICKFQLLKSREAFRQNPPQNCDRKSMGILEGTFALCLSLYHAYELLLMHGIRSFYNFLQASFFDAKKPNFYVKNELQKNELFLTLMNSLKASYDSIAIDRDSTDVSMSLRVDDTSMKNQSVDADISLRVAACMSSHPKMEKLKEILVNHFKFYKEKNQSTRVMVFSQYRDSVTEIASMLKAFEPLIKPMSFIGQSSKGGKGITQKEQIRVVKQFRSGDYNTLISTCVGEEGLDIGEVDLIVCYDAPKSPIRLVQRMGRTGRKRDGRIVVLVTKGKEEQSYRQSQYKKKSLLTAIMKGDKLTRFLIQNCPRMIPGDVEPECLKLKMHVSTYEPQSKGKGKSPRKKMNSYLNSYIENKGHDGESKLLSEEEMNFYKENYEVEKGEIKCVPRPTFNDMESKLKGSDEVENEGEKNIDLSEYQPWYTTLQQCYNLSHSKVSRNLVHLTDFINLQQAIGDNDNYTLEMAPFVNEKYFQNENLDTGQAKLSKSSSFIKTKKKNKNKKTAATTTTSTTTNNNKNKSKEKKIVKRGIQSYFVDLKNSTSKKDGENLSNKVDDIIVAKKVTVKADEVIVDISIDSVEEENRLINDSQLIDFDVPQKLKSYDDKSINKVVDGPSIESLFKSALSLEDSSLFVKNSVLLFDDPPIYDSLSESLFLRPSFVLSVHAQIDKVNKNIISSKFDSLFSRCIKNSFLSEEKLLFDNVSKPYREFESCKIPLERTKISKDELNMNESPNCNMSVDYVDIDNDKSVNDLPNFELEPLHEDKNDSLSNVDRELCHLKMESMNNSHTGLLTPPKEFNDQKLPCVSSPLFQSRRPPWIENSSSIYSSTPIADKSKILFGNSSLTITPISIDQNKNKLSAILNSKAVHGTKDNLRKQIIDRKNSESKAGPEVSKVKNRPEVNNETDVVFDLFMDDDDIFANIDLDEVTRKAELKYSSDKEKSTSSTESTTNDRSRKLIGAQIGSPSLLTVTQVIDIINEPTQSFRKVDAKSFVLPKESKKETPEPGLSKEFHTYSHLKNGLIQDWKPNIKKYSCSDFQKNSLTDKKVTGSHLFSKPRTKIVKNLSSEFSKDKITSNSSFQYSQSDISTSGSQHCDNSTNIAVNDVKCINRSLMNKKRVNTNHFEKETIVQFDMGLDGFDDLLSPSQNSKSKSIFPFKSENKLLENKSVDLYKSQAKSLDESDDLFEDPCDEIVVNSQNKLPPLKDNTRLSSIISEVSSNQIVSKTNNSNKLVPKFNNMRQLKGPIDSSKFPSKNNSNFMKKNTDFVSTSESSKIFPTNFQKDKSVDSLHDTSVFTEDDSKNSVSKIKEPPLSPTNSLLVSSKISSVVPSKVLPNLSQNSTTKSSFQKSPTFSSSLSQVAFIKDYVKDNSRFLTSLSAKNTTRTVLQTSPTFSPRLLQSKLCSVKDSPTFSNSLSPNNITEISPKNSLIPLNLSKINTSLSPQKNSVKLSVVSPFAQKKSDAEESPIIKRKRNRVNALDSECDESILNLPSMSKSTSTSRVEVISHLDRSSDDDFDIPVDKTFQPRRDVGIEKKKKKHKQSKVPALIDVEAAVDDSVAQLSSDETDSSSDEYDSSFVDDEALQTQQNVDMQAVYLKSVRSPLKRELKIKRNAAVRPILDETFESFEDEEEEEDSFVVDNDVVEYDTEYMGDTMLAADPIINQALTDLGSKKIGKTNQKRRRIVEIDSSSEDERVSPKKSRLNNAGNNSAEGGKRFDEDKNRITDEGKNMFEIETSEELRNTKDKRIKSQEISVIRKKDELITKGIDDDIASFDLLPDDDFLLPSSRKQLTSPKSSTVSNVLLGKISPKIGSTRKFDVKSLSYSGRGLSRNSGGDCEGSPAFASQKAQIPFDSSVRTPEVLPPDTFKWNAMSNGITGEYAITLKNTTTVTPRIFNTTQFSTTDKTTKLSPTTVNNTINKERDISVIHKPPFNKESSLTSTSTSYTVSESESLMFNKPFSRTSVICSTSKAVITGNKESAPITSVLKSESPIITSVLSSVPKNRSSIIQNPLPSTSSSYSVSKSEASKSMEPIFDPFSSCSLSKASFKNSESINQPVNASIRNVLQDSEKQCILVDTSEVSMAGIISSTLRLRHGAQTYVIQVIPASYIISSRMAVFRQSYSAFSNSVNRSRLILRFRHLLQTYERVVIIVERDSKAGTNILPRTFYLDTISCACAQLPQLQVLYSCDQYETADLIWSLANKEKLKGNAIPCLPSVKDHVEQAIKFYRTIPAVSAASAIFLALNFRSIKEAVNSNFENLKKNGRMSSAAAAAFQAHFGRNFRKDLLNSSLKYK